MNRGTALLRKFSDSCREMGNLRTITLIAMLLAISIVLSFFTIQVSESLRLGLGYLITATMGMLFGPVTAGIAAGVGDIVKYLVKPSGAFSQASPSQPCWAASCTAWSSITAG